MEMKSFLGFSFPDAVTWRVPVASQVSGVLDTMKKALILAAALGLTVGGAFAQDKGKGKGAAGDAKAGKEVFEGNCGVCHDTGTEARVGPGLKGVTKKATLVTKKAPTDANLLELLNGGSGSMPAFADLMNAKEKADVIAFVKTL